MYVLVVLVVFSDLSLKKILFIAPLSNIPQHTYIVGVYNISFILEWDIRIPSAFQPNHSNRMKTTLNLFDPI